MLQIIYAEVKFESRWNFIVTHLVFSNKFDKESNHATLIRFYSAKKIIIYSIYLEKYIAGS